MDEKEAIRRLVFIKYLYNLGIEQSEKPEPFSWTSILTLHDAVELFLMLAAEKLGISEKTLLDLRFAKYWDNINPKLKDLGKGELTQRIAMEKLNEVRVAFKHHGTEPHSDAINSAKVNVDDFLNENTLAIFGVKFSDISLIDLVQLETAKASLKEATTLKNKDVEAAIDNIAISFNQIVDDYVDRKRDSHGQSMFDLINVGGWDRIDGTDKKLASSVIDAFRVLGRGLDQLNEKMKVIALGLDYRKFLRFEALTAREVGRWNGKYAIQRLGPRIDGKLAEEDIQFCINFVIECAVTLEENDFKFAPKKYKFFEL